MPGEPGDWLAMKERIGHELKRYYQACTSEELPPSLVVLLKKLENEFPKEQN